MTQLYPEFERILITEEEIKTKVGELAAQISEDFQGKGSIVLVSILKGAFMFTGDLSRQLTIPHYIDFMALSSYGSKAVSGTVRILLDLRADVYNKHVLIVEDIVDTGNTLNYLYTVLQTKKHASLSTCALSLKEGKHLDVKVDYLGFEIPDVWVVGYGLDFAERHRTWPFIAELKKEVYQG
jgi:hypoxanthine phosphoribosyltransferase